MSENEQAEQDGDLTTILGNGIGSNDRVSDLVNKQPVDKTEDFLQRAASIIDAQEGEQPESQDGEADYGDDLFLDTPAGTQAPQFQPDQQAAGTLGQWHQRLAAEAQAFDRDYQSVNWEELRQDDPGEYAARMQEFQDRRAAFEVTVEGLAGQCPRA